MELRTVMDFPSFHQDRSRRAFTLVELLTVMAIVLLLAYVTIPAGTSFQQSNNLALAGQSVADVISIAREMAASRNQVVELRFIAPTSWATASGYTGFHALQLWAPNTSGASEPAAQMLTLPSGVEISYASGLSPLLKTLCAAKTAMPSGAIQGNYVSFYIRPTGLVQVANSLVEDSAASAPSYFLTILPVKYDASTTVPLNYLTLQVNPDTGRTLAYRP
jgi:uncharacterized protein (TIGR02596 family)